MQRSSDFPAPWLLGGLLTAIVLQNLVKIFAGLGLVADGSFFLLSILDKQDIVTSFPSRWFAHAVTQAPLLLALKAGIREMNVIIYLHSFGLIAIPVALWILALWKLKATAIFWPFFMIFCVVYFNLSLFPIGEANFAFALAALSMSILLGAPAPLSPSNGAILSTASIVSVFSYEAFAFLGVLLVAVSVARLTFSRARHSREIVWLSLAIFSFGCASAVSWWSIARPHAPPALTNAIDLASALNNKQLLLCVAVGALYALQLVAGPRRALRIAAAIAGFILVLILLHPTSWALPAKNYQSRVAISFTLFLMLGSLAVWHYWNSSLDLKEGVSACRLGTAWALPVALFATLSIASLTYTIGFYNYLRVFHREVISRSGIVPFEATPLIRRNLARYGWGWTNPSLSILLRSEAQHAIILNRADYSGWQPFDADKFAMDARGYRMTAGRLFLK